MTPSVFAAGGLMIFPRFVMEKCWATYWSGEDKMRQGTNTKEVCAPRFRDRICLPLLDAWCARDQRRAARCRQGASQSGLPGDNNSVFYGNIDSVGDHVGGAKEGFSVLSHYPQDETLLRG